MLRSTEKEKLKASVPQVFTPSSSGFTSSYLMDTVATPSFRCFLYLDSEVEPSSEDLGKIGWVSHFAAVSFAGSDCNTFVTNLDSTAKTALKMKTFYSEGTRKKRMRSRDILVLQGGLPFAVDLPFRLRVPSARMISWCLYRDG